MKALILIFTLMPFFGLSEVQEITDGDIKKKFLTVVKDAEVEGMLNKTSEFTDCRKESEFKADDDDAKRTAKLKKATDCFKQKISGKNADALKKLSDDLNLQSYGLIKSKNVSDITDYLSEKMTKALTGKDPKDKSLASMQWKNQKIVDQKVFIDLYTNQLVKGALFEVSRYCFENLRNKVGPTSDFSTHWTASDAMKMVDDEKGKQIPDISNLDDLGKESFFKINSETDMSKQDEVYKNLMSGLSGGQQVDPGTFEKFFPFCQAALPLLCEKFKTAVKGQSTNDNSTVDTKITKNEDMSAGANSCLTMDKLRSIRTSMKNTELVAKQFAEMGEDKDKFALQMINNPKIYQRGKGSGEESLDEISSISSTDMLSGAEDNKLDQLEKDCAIGGNGNSECENYLVKSDSLEKAITNVESEMNLKREIEKERVKELKKKPDDLKKYLTDNGMFDVLEKLEKDPNLDIEKEIETIYDARKIAEIESLKLKVGKRQISEKDDKSMSDDDKKAMIKANITDSKEERARLAQVVMFNNIITSQLSLTDKSTGKEVGRNVNAWKKEAKGLEGVGVDKDLFKGLQDIADKEGSKLDDTSVVGGGIIDAILGKAADP